MKTIIQCGCGYYAAESLEDYDQHLGEHVAENDGNILLYMERARVQTLWEEDEIEQQDYENKLLDYQIPGTAIYPKARLSWTGRR